LRLDKYLKVSRIIKRRTVANEACDAGRVSVNGKAARASYDVKVGDEVEISFGTRIVRVEVLSLNETIHKEDAVLMYKIIEQLKCPLNIFLRGVFLWKKLLGKTAM